MDIIEEYFKILSPKYPRWLDKYINTKRMQKQKHVSVTCGKVYCKLFKEENFSSLNHSIAVALIIWNFTHDKKQTLAGLFHDIATPAFKHAVDYLNGDYMNQESTEELTRDFIENSPDIMELLKKDKITVDEVCDYKIYPIADNDTPKLSADRLEYSLSNGLIVFKEISIDEVREMYNDIEIEIDEEGVTELGFKTKEIARNFVKLTSKLSLHYRDDPTRFYMQALADVLKKVSNDGLITKSDLYELSESEVIDIINNSNYKDIFNTLINISGVTVSLDKPENIYYLDHPAKIRYIDPLCNGVRISKECELSNKMIEDNKAYNMNNYVYIDEAFNVLW